MNLQRECLIPNLSWRWSIVTLLTITIVEAAALSGAALLLGKLAA